jgi:hypothetical protein
MRAIFILVQFAFLVSCSNQLSKKDFAFYSKVKTYSDSIPYEKIGQIGEFYILSKQLDFLRVVDSAKYFCYLNNDELAEVEYLLRNYIKEDYLKYKFYYTDPIKLEEYHRQYVTFITRSGEKITWINCFCWKNPSFDWRFLLVQVSDGGACYFKAKINLSKRQVVYLMINGSA